MNLLPEKEVIEKGLKSRFLIFTSYLVAIFFVIGTVMLLPSYFLIQSNLNEIESEKIFLSKENSNSTKDVLNLPKKLEFKLNLLRSNSIEIKATDYLAKIISFLPEGVTLESLSFSFRESVREKPGIAIAIAGFAEERDPLVSFVESLKKSNLFTSVEVPVSNFTKDKNLPFSVNIFIEKNK